MSKQEFMKRHGLKLRPVTQEDRAAARTDYQRCARFIITDGAREYYSTNGTLRDMEFFVKSGVYAK